MVRPVRCEREAQTRREVEFAMSHENLRVLLPPNVRVQVAARVATTLENKDLMKDTQSRLTCNELLN